MLLRRCFVTAGKKNFFFERVTLRMFIFFIVFFNRLSPQALSFHVIGKRSFVYYRILFILHREKEAERDVIGTQMLFEIKWEVKYREGLRISRLFNNLLNRGVWLGKSGLWREYGFYTKEMPGSSILYLL